MNSKIISACITAFIMLMLLLICLIIAYYPPDPPIPEEGVEVAMGFDEAGLGESAASAASPQQQTSAAASDHSAQRTEESVALPNNSKGRTTNPNAVDNSKTEQKEAVNSKALYPGRKTNTTGGQGQGDSQGHGQQGNPNGTPGATNYHGTPGNGSSFSLAGRSSVSLPLPSKDFSREGKIVVKIWVDQQGKVTKTEAPQQGSTITDVTMVRQAEQAARRSLFNADPNAAVIQTGTITYVFRKQ